MPAESQRRVDVVILTAITLEYQAVLQVEAGAQEGSRWEPQQGPNGLPVAFRTFRGKQDRGLRVAVAQAADMGAVAATNALLPLVEAYRPRCVAMCGVCAGRPEKTNLGDVIAAERLFFHDTGKRLPDTVEQDLKTYNLRDDWKVALEHFEFASRYRDESWWKARPVPHEWQEAWVLAKLNEELSDPGSISESAPFNLHWGKVIESLWDSGMVQDGMLALTEEGRRYINRLLIKHRNRFPDVGPSGQLHPFKVHVAPMGSGNQVVEDEDIWSFISESMRKTLGLEMEATALGQLAHAQRERRLTALVMKGVMDFANHGRDDHFKAFAARASAECLIAFLREHLDVEVVPDTDDLLVLGTGEMSPEVSPPSAQLHPRYEVVPFHTRGREAILAELGRWSNDGNKVAVRLLHAEGGIGKTRLAIEWIRQRKAEGWAAGFLSKDVPDNWFERLWMLGQQVLVVIDYAESRPDLRMLLMRVLRYSQQEGTGNLHRMRILLLARNSGDWWQSLLQTDIALGAWLDSTPPFRLPPLATEKTERERIFQEAAERFAALRGKAYVGPASVSLADECFDRVLYLHMAALASVEGLSFEANTLMDVILDHEERFWEMRAQQAAVPLAMQRSFARQLVAAATLRGGFPDASTASSIASRLLGHTPALEDRALLLLLQRVYQRPGEASGAFLPALEPDLLGEGIVLRVASPVLQGDRPPSDWIERVFPADDTSQAVSIGLEVLGRASTSHPNVVLHWLKQLLAGPLRPRARLALKAAKVVGKRTAFSALGLVLAERLQTDGDAGLARELEDDGIPDRTLSLRRVAEWVSRTLLEALPASGPDEVLDQRARHLDAFGRRLSHLGRNQEALPVMHEAVQLYRELGTRHPKKFEPNLASSIDHLGGILSELGRHEEALKALHDAADLRRVLMQDSPAKFRADFAISLNNVALVLNYLGRNKEAKSNALGAVAQSRILVQNQSATFWPDLAVSLNTLGLVLNGLGQHPEALKATREAAGLYRALTRIHADAFSSELAMSLGNLGNMMSDIGEYEDALDAAIEVVKLFRSLARDNHDAFGLDLARSLNNLGNRLSQLERNKEALAAASEAVSLCRAQERISPIPVRIELARQLCNLDAILSALNRHEEALTASREAVVIYRGLVQNDPSAFQPALANSLGNLGTTLGVLGQTEEALTAMQDCIKIFRSLAHDNPEAFQSPLAMCLNNLGSILSTVGRYEEAFTAVNAAVETIWPPFERIPRAFVQPAKSMLQFLQELHKHLQRPVPPLLRQRVSILENLP
nr:tetratricopeptide repeat protein [Myxococcus landrumus]